ncbi:MAG: phage tail protein [Deltaproteobacteria bacterium]|nr:phage tail protein [Deltaproteobacteria bacterium]
MAGQKGRDFLLKMGDGATTEAFVTIGAARTNSMAINNNPVDDTTMDDAGVQSMIGDAGVQSMTISIDGLFKDAVIEETFRAAALARTTGNFQLLFPNGDDYEAAFVIQDYNRSGSHDGAETFSATLVRSGAGTHTTV